MEKEGYRLPRRSCHEKTIYLEGMGLVASKTFLKEKHFVETMSNVRGPVNFVDSPNGSMSLNFPSI